MNPIRTIRRLAYALTALATAAAALTAAAPAALASIPLPPGNPRTHSPRTCERFICAGLGLGGGDDVPAGRPF
jgi:hypothetical protein